MPGSTCGAILRAAHDPLRKLNRANDDGAQSGDAEHASHVSGARRKLAVEGNEEEWFRSGAWKPESDTDLAVFSNQT